MIIKEEFDIQYNSHTGYYEIIDDNGKAYGEFLTYDDADEAVNDIGVEIEEAPEDEYVVCRQYESRGKGYIMFSQGSLSKHVSYSIQETYNDFNDKSIKTYTKDEAVQVAKEYNQISKKNGFKKHQNWKAVKKWW